MILLSCLSYYCIQLFSLYKTLLRVLDITKKLPKRAVLNISLILLITNREDVFLQMLDSLHLSIFVDIEGFEILPIHQ